MSRKLTVLLSTMFAVALGAASLNAAPYDDSPLAKLMEKIQKNTNDIRKATRTAPAWKKDSKNVATAAEAIVAAAKESKPMTDPVKKAKKTVDEWNKLMDDLIKESDALAKLAAKSGTTQAQAKDAFSAVTKTCAACHTVFKTEE